MNHAGSRTYLKRKSSSSTRESTSRNYEAGGAYWEVLKVKNPPDNSRGCDWRYKIVVRLYCDLWDFSNMYIIRGTTRGKKNIIYAISKACLLEYNMGLRSERMFLVTWGWPEYERKSLFWNKWIILIAHNYKSLKAWSILSGTETL